MTNGASIMTVTTRRAALLLPLAASIALAGCQTTQASATSSGGDMSVADLEFVTNAFDIINFDREECGLAQTQAKSPEVKAIAGTLLAQANQFDAELRPVAQEAGVKPPTILPTRLRIRAGRLRLGQGLILTARSLPTRSPAIRTASTSRRRSSTRRAATHGWRTCPGGATP